MDNTKTKSSDLLENLSKYGAVFNQEQDYMSVQNYGSVEKEYHALTDFIGIRIMPGKGIYKLKGADTLDFLHRITTNDVKNLQVNEVTHTIFTNENGRIIDYVTLINNGDHYLMTGCPGYEEKLVKWIEKYIFVDDVEIHTLRDELVIFEILGPNADRLAKHLCGNSGNSIDENKFIPLTIENISFNLILHKVDNNEQRYRVIVEQENSADLLKSILNDKLGINISLIGEEAYEIVRIENGIPGAPNELNENINPHEVGMINVVSFTKGCYIGQEIIARLDTYDKVQKHLRTLIFQTDKVPEGDYKLYTEDGIRAGHLTSLTHSKKFNKPVGLGYIRKDYNLEGTILKARIENKDDMNIPDSYDVVIQKSKKETKLDQKTN